MRKLIPFVALMSVLLCGVRVSKKGVEIVTAATTIAVPLTKIPAGDSVMGADERDFREQNAVVHTA
jgi:hypothetical protein